MKILAIIHIECNFINNAEEKQNWKNVEKIDCASSGNFDNRYPNWIVVIPH